MKLEETTLDQLQPGDLFFYPQDVDTAGVQVNLVTDSLRPEARVVRIVFEPEEKP